MDSGDPKEPCASRRRSDCRTQAGPDDEAVHDQPERPQHGAEYYIGL